MIFDFAVFFFSLQNHITIVSLNSASFFESFFLDSKIALRERVATSSSYQQCKTNMVTNNYWLCVLMTDRSILSTHTVD